MTSERLRSLLMAASSCSRLVTLRVEVMVTVLFLLILTLIAVIAGWRKRKPKQTGS